MNAVDTTKKMAQELINAGFDVTVEETATSYNFSAMSKNNVFDTTYIFTAGAYITSGNRTRKYYSATRSTVFAKTQSKRNISYNEMYREIDWAIRMTRTAKVGA